MMYLLYLDAFNRRMSAQRLPLHGNAQRGGLNNAVTIEVHLIVQLATLHKDLSLHSPARTGKQDPGAFRMFRVAQTRYTERKPQQPGQVLSLF